MEEPAHSVQGTTSQKECLQGGWKLGRGLAFWTASVWPDCDRQSGQHLCDAEMKGVVPIVSVLLLRNNACREDGIWDRAVDLYCCSLTVTENKAAPL